jgi:ribosomal protein S18 acetylase RimI-like enzyme
VVLALDQVGRFERVVGESVHSLIRASLAIAGNPEGYALYRDGAILASLSRNPRAAWATQTYGVNAQPADALRRLVAFFTGHGVPARVRIVPGALTADVADILSGQGLRQVGFHTILWSPLPLAVEPVAGVDIRPVTTVGEMDAHIDVQLGAYGVPADVVDRLRPLRRTWLRAGQRRLYLAYVDGRPAAQAMLGWHDGIAYLESAGTLPAYRRRGLQRALIRRRIADAIELGCRTIIGGADFESESRTNQLACGLSVAYLAAQWVQGPRRGALPPFRRSSPA